MEGINVGLLLDVFLIVFGGYLVLRGTKHEKDRKTGKYAVRCGGACQMP